MTNIRAAIVALALAIFAGTAMAKIPAPPMTDEQKAKAAEAKANAAETAKKQAELLAKYQDKAADNYKRGAGKAKPAVVAGKSKK